MALTGRTYVFAVLVALLGAAPVAGQIVREHTFDAPSSGEAIATIAAGCARCDWGAPGREAVALKLSVDGVYSQHLLLTRGERLADYAVMLGPIPAGKHRLSLERDPGGSAQDAGDVVTGTVSVRIHGPDSPEYKWIMTAPILHARPGTVERFSDVPLFMYVERGPDRGLSYTVIFSHEDGGTPTDRLMATWGRSTDIEYVYGVGMRAPDGEYQARDHEILPFRGSRSGGHPLLWVSTDNNMFSDTGPADAVRFAPAPQLAALMDVSREAVMDANPWLYRVMASELAREGRIDAAATAGTGKVPDPRDFAVIEACGDLKDATLAFDIGIEAGGEMRWYPTDRGDARFRIARSGCFRSAVPVPPGTKVTQLRSLRARAHTRPPRSGETPLAPGTGRVALRRVNRMFMLDADYAPNASGLWWAGTLRLSGESAAVPVRVTRSNRRIND